MRIGILMLGGVLVVATAVSGLAADQVNCKQVNKYLQTGRSAKDVAETMVISESDVEKCKAQAGSDQPKTDTKSMGSEAGEKGAGH